MERRERYTLRDILVDDLDIGTSEARKDPFEEIRLQPSLLIEERTIPGQSEDCCNRCSANTLEENLNSSSERNKTSQTSKRQIEQLERHPCTVHERSKENKTKVSSLKKFKTFFKLTL